MTRKKYYTYILGCADDSYYIGVTNDLERRLEEHQQGIHPESYTYSRRPIKLLYHEETRYILKAIRREKQLKRWSRKKKEALINSNLKELKNLSKKDFSK